MTETTLKALLAAGGLKKAAGFMLDISEFPKTLARGATGVGTLAIVAPLAVAGLAGWLSGYTTGKVIADTPEDVVITKNKKFMDAVGRNITIRKQMLQMANESDTRRKGLPHAVRPTISGLGL